MQSTIFVSANKMERNGRIIDVRYDLTNEQFGKQLYKEGHIEGAIYWDLNDDLSDMTRDEGRHPLPSKEQLQQLFEQNGLYVNDAIYIYDQGASPFATRAWWILHYAGFNHAYVVNGGFEAMKGAGFSISKEVPIFAPTMLNLQWNDEILLKRSDMVRLINGESKTTILDARANARYRGEIEPLDAIAGHIPTAKNYDWEQLREGKDLVITSSLLAKVKKDEDIVVYCGSGVTATPVYSILKQAGYEKVKIYMAGYSDWVKHETVEQSENL
ncbi:sulfurtransferase [Solibacillus sp. MA9]|uniref:Sulfurtransferase n=1 Tax=Solibacillus palustris TaxID=2908203 RepID=A0ABS9UB07_9BACL|nr:rhodanese-like domain-containing protein [Solibacillus sp. MA9]MCH7321300.1 sulfurtransferase [Solibacillus sp. MA9]